MKKILTGTIKFKVDLHTEITPDECVNWIENYLNDGEVTVVDITDVKVEEKDE